MKPQERFGRCLERYIVREFYRQLSRAMNSADEPLDMHRSVRKWACERGIGAIGQGLAPRSGQG